MERKNLSKIHELNMKIEEKQRNLDYELFGLRPDSTYKEEIDNINDELK